MNAHEMNAHEPIRQEAAHAQAKKKQKVTLVTGNVLVADAREAGEPQLYYFSLDDAPDTCGGNWNEMKRAHTSFLSMMALTR